MESFKGTFRDECLNEHGIISPPDAKAEIETRRVDCNTNNTFRPHSTLGERAPGGLRRPGVKPPPAHSPQNRKRGLSPREIFWVRAALMKGRRRKKGPGVNANWCMGCPKPTFGLFP
ncbi:MAG: integrase core domain-containing protein [Vicinamibacterales bacterium]